MAVECDVYKSLRHEYMYLYVDQKDGLDRVPEALMSRFGPHEIALSLTLDSDRHLARENAAVVLANIAEHGYHLQLPPADEGAS